MRLERLVIRNFRALGDVAIDLHPRMTVLIGPNNTGKTSVLDALSAILSFRGGISPFSGLDFRSAAPDADIRDAAPIQIDLHVAPSASSKFEPGELGSVMPQIRSDGAERVFLRLETVFDRDPSDPRLSAALSHLKEDGSSVGDETFGGFPFRDQLPLRAFGTERDLRRGLAGRWSDWRGAIADARPDSAVRDEALRLLQAGSDHLIAGTPELATIRKALGRAGSALGLDGTDVRLTAAPQDVEELLNNVSIELQLPGAGRGFHAERHGLGTQGALLFAVFRHQVERLALRGVTTPVLTVEEPEAHLHPTAQRAIAQQLASIQAQVVVSSHSPELLSAADSSVVILRNSPQGSVARTMRRDSKHYVREHVRALFARCILIVEGLEAEALDLCARSLSMSLAELGAEVVNARGQANIAPIWETFGPNGYGALVVCIADADEATHIDAFLRSWTPQGQPLPAGPDRYTALEAADYFVAAPDMNIEEMLVAHDSAAVDRAFEDRGDDAFPDWRIANKQQGIKGSLASRFAKLRTGGAKPAVVGDLTDSEARIRRLASQKGEGIICDVFRVLTKGGTDPSGLPASYVSALRRVEVLAKGPAP